MINQRHCPFCGAAAAAVCSHLALAVEGKDFVSRCVELSDGQSAWQAICRQQQELHRISGLPKQEDYMWLETAFCERFVKHLAWFGGMDYEWRSGRRAEQGGFCVLIWSKEPRRLWWELHGELEKKAAGVVAPEPTAPWLVWLAPR